MWNYLATVMLECGYTIVQIYAIRAYIEDHVENGVDGVVAFPSFGIVINPWVRPDRDDQEGNEENLRS